jgi:hypothetical protein
MKILVSLAVLLISSTASSQPAPGFAKLTSCDSQGRTFGTAHEMTHCYKYAFAPNGTFTVNGGTNAIGGSAGTYRVIGSTVRLTPVFAGKPGKPYDLVLSADGKTLGDMKLVP